MANKNTDKQPRLFDEQFISLGLDEIVADRFGRYAKYIIQDRALPDARDGLKPVQRRILHAMSELGLTNDKPHKKSARTVGEVIGKYHPHGDQSIYDAMVRMAQDWKNNAPLVDMHGNKGSIDGDNAAAMRYTEARLAEVAQLMIEDIKKNTVRFVANFDDSETEPSVLPGKLPNLLVNGATGIAAGYATNIPPHNLGEVVDATIARIDSPNCRVETLLKAIKGPDFPTGGIIQGAEGIKNAFTTGKGRIILRAKMFHEKTKTANRWVITEIPYDTVKSAIVREIDEIRLESKIGGIEEVRDESDRTGLRIAIDLKKDAAVEAIKNYLLKSTSLQVSYNINMVTIVDRKPVLLGLGEILDAYISHQLAVMVAAATWDLAETVRRVEIVEGLIKAVSILDEVVETIRRSADKEDAKKNLCAKFGFSENQAEAIVQLRLYRLTSTNVDQLKAELSALVVARDELQALLEHEELRRNKLKSTLRKIKSDFGKPRKSQVEEQIEELRVDVTQTIANEKLCVVCSHDGYLKTVSAKSADLSEWDLLGLKPSDWPVAYGDSRSLAKTVLVTAKGKFVSIPNYRLPAMRWKDVGAHLNTMTTLDASDKIIAGWQVDDFTSEKRTVALASKKGLIKRVLLSDLEMQKYNKPSTLFTLGSDDELVGACLVNAETDKLCVLTASGLALAYEASEVAVHGTKAAGVKAISMEDDRLAALTVFDKGEQQIALFARNGGKRVYASEIAHSSRANKGRTVWSQLKGEPLVLQSAFAVGSSDSVGLVDLNGKWSVIKATDVPIGDKETRVSHLPVRQIGAAVLIKG